MSRIHKLFDLTDEVIIVTGGAGFLGSVHAEAILEANGIPVLLDINQNELESVQTRLKGIHPTSTLVGLKVDITNANEVTHAQDYLLNRFGKIDVLINNAATNPVLTHSGEMRSSHRFEKMPLAQWDYDIAVGLTGAFLCSQVFGSSMAHRRKGIILNISSDLGIIGPDQRLYHQDGLSEEEQTVKPVTYSVVKAGISGLTRYLATYWADKNIRVNTLSLGGVFNDQPATFLERVNDRIPLKRLANRDEYMGCIVFLCSPASSYMTGANLVVDGGRTIW
jgi:NAD(P)-dependent dehydrogenase (short-subunit alcohol dehydrogenase family)